MSKFYLYQNALGDATLDVGSIAGDPSLMTGTPLSSTTVMPATMPPAPGAGASTTGSILSAIGSVTGSIAKIFTPSAGTVTLTPAQQAALAQNPALLSGQSSLSSYMPLLVIGIIGIGAVMLLKRK